MKPSTLKIELPPSTLCRKVVFADSLRQTNSPSPARLKNILLLAALAVAGLSAGNALAVSTTVAISQVYGGGGNNPGATYLNDFIELHNISACPVNITGWSVQYADAGSTNWSVTTLSGTIPAGGYYLVWEASAGITGTNLPTADATGTISMALRDGKVALVNTTTALTNSGCPIGASVVDFVGYGTANCFEGTAAAPRPPANNATAVVRAANGCTDTDNNSSDIATANPPTPRNSASTNFLCATVTPPAITCPTNVTVQCASAVPAAATSSSTFSNQGGTISAQCSVTIVSSDVTNSLGCPNHFTITRTYTVTAGASSTCNQTITVNDTTAPAITCPASVTNDCSVATTTNVTGVATATDDCSGVASITFSDADAPGSCAGNHVITRTWTATDTCGNFSTCDQTITVTDTTAPAITCPANVTNDCSVATTTNVTGVATATDDCSGVASITFSDVDAPGSCAGNHVITRTWTATDNCGNFSTCDQTITVTDTTAPAITCPANVTNDCSVATTTNITGVATATDDCSGVASITFSDVDAPGSCAGNHVITRTWTATDTCGNFSTCDQTITVTDTTAPAITCPANVTNDCSVATTTNVTGVATASDDCSGVASITFSDVDAPGSCAGNHVITRTWTATDTCGNFSTCDQTITVTDTTAPAITCPANVTNDCSVATTTNITGVATATDDCSGVASITFSDVDAPGSCAGNHVITRTWTATDNCGNFSTCDQTITVTDTTAPAITCPANVTNDCSVATTTNVTGVATATDDCSGVASITFSDVDAPGSCAGNHVITRTWTATDTCGNFSTCDQTITVTDTTAPAITCPANVTNDCSVATTTNITGVATATDDCSGVASITFSDVDAPGSCAGNHVITRTWTATDTCGNFSTCDQTITVTDTTAPAITCPANVTNDCSVATTTNITGVATATDDCSGVASITFSDVDAPGSCAGNHVITRTWTATDTCGNFSTCDQTITVTDTTAPAITCPANVTNDCSVATTTNVTGVATATDDCSGVASITFSDVDAPGSCAGNHVITRTWTATDTCGNFSTCDQTITVTDTTAPAITCPANVTNDCSVATTTNVTGVATASDDCSGVASITFSDVDAPGSCAGNHVITRTWTATDTCGNFSTCDQTITVTDTTAPAITCPANVTNDCSVATTTNVTGVATASDDCSGVASITFSDVDAPGSCAGNHVITRTWTATDTCGNFSTCDQTITVTATPPTLNIELQGADVVISWPLTCNPYILEQTPSLSPPVTWTPTPEPVVVVNNRNTVTVPVGNANQFFRLRCP